ncbi:Uncharacterised protein [Candidatus Norongarragalina meridionalis]|nr:Uncharacterised protein [Candidatus Norongarragalina meridionalis]
MLMAWFSGRKRLAERDLKHNMLTYSSTGEREAFERTLQEYLSSCGNVDLNRPLSDTDLRTALHCTIMADSDTLFKRLLDLGVIPTEKEKANAKLKPRFRKILIDKGFLPEEA